MAKLIDYFYGKMTECQDRKNRRYKDWRKQYCDKPGLIAIYESESKAKGKKFVYFFPYDEKSRTQNWFHTGVGTIDKSGDIYQIWTVNSAYTFAKDESVLTDEQKDTLYSWTLGAETEDSSDDSDDGSNDSDDAGQDDDWDDDK